MSYVPANKQSAAPLPPSSLMSYFDSSRTATPNASAPLARGAVPPAAAGVCAHDVQVPAPKPEQPRAQPLQTRSRSDSIASSYKQYFAQNSQHQLAHSETNVSRSASMTSSMRGGGDRVPGEAPLQQRAAPYPHEPSKPVRESATTRQAAAPRAAPPVHAYPTEMDEWDAAEEPVMREESPLDTQAAAVSEEPMMAPPPRNASEQNASRAAAARAPQSSAPFRPAPAAAPAPTSPKRSAKEAVAAYAASDDSRRSPYTPREVARAETTPVRRAVPTPAVPAAEAGGVALPAHSNLYMEPGTPRSDRDTPRRKSDARRLNPHSNSYDPVYAANTPRSDEDRDSITRSERSYPAYESLGEARGTPLAAAQPPSQPTQYARQQPQQTYPSHYQPRSTPGAGPAGPEDPRQQYPSQYRSLYRPEVRPKRDDAAPNFPFNRSESSVVADSTTTSERGYRPPFDLSPKRPEDYIADDMELDDEEANCTFQPNLDRRSAKERAAAVEESGEEAAPVFSRLYADAQRVNRLREERERALELQRQMRRGEIPYDAEALRAAGLSVNEIDETELAVGASRRATLRLPDDAASSDAGEGAEEAEEAASQADDAARRRRSSVARKKVDFEVFERLSKPQAITPKYQRALELKQQAEKDEENRREEAKRDALENIGRYEWGLPAKSFTMADLRQQNALFAK